MTEWRPQKVNEIDNKLRDDFRRLYRDTTGAAAQASDPILAVLFRSFAARVADVYEQAAETIPVALLDEMMAGLHMPERMARPAQAVVRFAPEDDYALFEQGTELIGETPSRDKLTFALDEAVGFSTAQIALVAFYQDGHLRLQHGETVMSKEFEDARPSYEAAPAELGQSPAIFIAVNVEGPEHLSRHGFYFGLVAEARDLSSHLRRATWCLLDNEGSISAEGLLRPRAGNGGVRRLEWLVTDASPPAPAGGDIILPEGFYGGRVFLFPEVPPARCFLSNVPRMMESPLRLLFQNPASGLWSRPRAWLRIPLPQEIKTAPEDIERVVLNCMTVSNVEVLNQTVKFATDGVSIPVGNASGQRRYLVRAISITGERGTNYVDASEVTADPDAGRYRFRAGCLEIEPSRTSRGVADRHANVRLLLTRGAGGNKVEDGGINNVLRRVAGTAPGITSLTVAAGGADGETLESMRQRFAELLLTRERVVTHADLEAVVRTYEPRVRHVECRPTLARTGAGLRRVQRVTVTLERESFVMHEVEAEVLQRELTDRLRERVLLGLEVEVDIAWA
jgi:hypothetical protein